MVALRDFKAAVRAAVLELPGAPEGFTAADLGQRLGASYCDGEGRARLRRWIKNHCDGQILTRLAHGRYAAGSKLAEDGALGAGVQLVDDIRDAFDAAGGVLNFCDLLIELDREDGTLVRRVLDESPRYQSGTPLPGYRRVWWLADAERLTLPVPGCLMAFDIQVMAGGPRADLPRLLRKRRTLIADALAEARAVAGFSIAQIVAVPAVAHALDAALRAHKVYRYRADGERDTWAAWWAERRTKLGRVDALAEAWAVLETEDAPLLMALTVRFWCAVGEALRVSAARLSRGFV